MIKPINVYPGCCGAKMPKPNYNDLKNKPKLAGVTLEGNVPLKTVNNESLIGKGNIEISGGTTNYNELEDRPTVNNQTLEGNVDLQEPLVSGTNIKTVNNQSLLGAGNIEITGGGGDAPIFILTDNTTYAELAAADDTYGFDDIVFFYSKPTGYFACTHKAKLEGDTTVYEFDFVGKYASSMLNGYYCYFGSDNTKEIHEHSVYLVQDLAFKLSYRLGIDSGMPTYAYVYDNSSGNEYSGYVFQISNISPGSTFKLFDFPYIYDVTYDREHETYTVTATSTIDEKFLNINTTLSNLSISVPPVTSDNAAGRFDYTLPDDLINRWKIISLGKIECTDTNNNRIDSVIVYQFTMSNQSVLRVGLKTTGTASKTVATISFNVLCERR